MLIISFGFLLLSRIVELFLGHRESTVSTFVIDAQLHVGAFHLRTVLVISTGVYWKYIRSIRMWEFRFVTQLVTWGIILHLFILSTLTETFSLIFVGLVIFQVSQPYRSTGLTMLLKIVILVWMDSWCVFHYCPKTSWTFLILFWITDSLLTFDVIVLPS